MIKVKILPQKGETLTFENMNEANEYIFSNVVNYIMEDKKMDIDLRLKIYGMIADCKGKINDLNDEIQRLEDFIINYKKED